MSRNISGLPDSKIYEKELQYWPYIQSWKKVLNYVFKNTPKNGILIDLMCGPGYLLGEVLLKRKDMKLEGIDIDKRYISYAKKKYPNIEFELKDILKFKSKKKYDVVLCTGSLHHIPYEKQEEVIRKIASLINDKGFAIISDCYVNDYSNEKERKIVAAKLGYEYLKETIQNGAPEKVIRATIEILWNDVLMKEFKTSMKKRMPIFKKYFREIKTIKTWPNYISGYGDYISICRNPFQKF